MSNQLMFALKCYIWIRINKSHLTSDDISKQIGFINAIKTVIIIINAINSNEQTNVKFCSF